MDSGVRMRRTWGRGSECPGVPADVSLHADAFIHLCDRNELRMRQVVEDLHDSSAKLQRLRSRSQTCSAVGTVTAALGVGAAVAAFTAPVSGGLSLLATAAAAYVAAAAAAVAFRAKQFTAEEERVRKVREFLQLVTELRSELEHITEDDDGIIRLTSDLLQPLLTAATPRSSVSAGCATELSHQCENVLDQFRGLKRKLEELRGRKDTEEVQKEEE